jgi:hypothetical protein
VFICGDDLFRGSLIHLDREPPAILEIAGAAGGCRMDGAEREHFDRIAERYERTARSWQTIYDRVAAGREVSRLDPHPALDAPLRALPAQPAGERRLTAPDLF